MGITDRIYRCTEAGRRACEDSDAGVSPELQRILRVVAGDTHWDVLRRSLASYSETQILQGLARLEDAALVESKPAGPEHDLDFTA